MGAIRGILLVTVCVLLFISVLAGSILWTVSSSLQYENVQSGLGSLVNNIIGGGLNTASEQLNIEDELKDIMPTIEAYCESNQQYR